MKLNSTTFRRISETAPVLTVMLLLLLPMLLPNQTVLDPLIAQRQAEIREEMEGLPFTIGRWVGTDVDVPAEAYELLKPNAILSRRYQRLPHGPAVTLVIVHCSDLRDLSSHYPPNCYPAAGWLVDRALGPGGRITTLDLRHSSFGVQEYRFTRSTDQGASVGLRIYNFFVFPDGTLSRGIDDIHRKSERLGVAAQGAAQVQIVMPLDLPEQVALEATGELLSGMRRLLGAIGMTEGFENAYDE